jgi:hypothetical protein
MLAGTGSKAWMSLTWLMHFDEETRFAINHINASSHSTHLLAATKNKERDL